MNLLLISILFAITATLLNSIKKIPSNPTHLAQTTLWGKRLPGKYKEEGWRFYLGYPYVYGFILVRGDRFDITVYAERVRTPDRAESRVPIFFTLIPDKELLINFLDSGGRKGVEEKLSAKTQERVREWSSGAEEGPTDWRELYQSHMELTSILVKKIAGSSTSLPSMPSYAQAVPTWIWLRYFSEPRPTKFFENEKVWGENSWARVTRFFNSLSSAQQHDLRTAVKNRKDEIERLRSGTGMIKLDDLGCYIQRLNVGDIDVLGGVAEQAEKEAKELEEKLGEEKELAHIASQIIFLQKPKNAGGAGLTREQALEMVQLATNKATKAIDAKLLSFDASTIALIKRILS